MGSENSYVRARVDPDTKERATAALAAMGLSVSDAIRLLMLRIAEEQRMPFDLRVPNKDTVEAIDELEAGKGKHFKDLDSFMDDLNAKYYNAIVNAL